MSRTQEYIKYHQQSALIGDIDPSHELLRYVCNRFELTTEQRYWLAWLYAMTYSGASVFYVYNEFPDAENVNIGRLTRWWDGGGRRDTLFQSDRRWCRSRNQFVPAFESYRKWLREKPQEEHFSQFEKYTTPEQRYDAVFRSASALFTMGRFTLFNYTQALDTITPLKLEPTELDFDDAWSPRDGLLFSAGLDQYVRDEAVSTPIEVKAEMLAYWAELRPQLAPSNIWAVETTLCAYRKYRRTLEGIAGGTGQRYVGYYLDRQADEIAKMQDHVEDGVAWDVLWQYRAETYDHTFLAEKCALLNPTGLAPNAKRFGINRTQDLVAP